jgi:hypothetical protein
MKIKVKNYLKILSFNIKIYFKIWDYVDQKLCDKITAFNGS